MFEQLLPPSSLLPVLAVRSRITFHLAG
jgi:hypothetical protein